MGFKDSPRYKIDIQSLTFKQHEYHFEGDSKFFDTFENSPVNKGKWECGLILDKSETMIQINFSIKGEVELICDRSLKAFRYQLNFSQRSIFKYGEEWEELDDEITIIPRNLDQLNIGSLIFEYIVLNLPMRKIHPDLNEEEWDEDLIYSTDEEFENEEAEEQEVDPRWENLKKLKNK